MLILVGSVGGGGLGWGDIKVVYLIWAGLKISVNWFVGVHCIQFRLHWCRIESRLGVPPQMSQMCNITIGGGYVCINNYITNQWPKCSSAAVQLPSHPRTASLRHRRIAGRRWNSRSCVIRRAGNIGDKMPRSRVPCAAILWRGGTAPMESSASLPMEPLSSSATPTNKCHTKHGHATHLPGRASAPTVPAVTSCTTAPRTSNTH
jgi:hypothetical protein